MKKNLLKVALVAAVAAAMAGYGVYANQTKEMMSDVMLENVEALARYELPEVTITCSRTCSDGVGRCYYKFDNWGNCHFNGDQNCYCTC